MSTDEPSPSGPAPDEAFALVADETRLEILRLLVEADEPLAFSTLFERSEYETQSNFSYHLDRLEGHFVRRTDDGYAVRQTGRRVVEAVISGTVTDDPVVERERTDRQCPFCSAPIEVSYRQERVEMYCTSCPGVGAGKGEPVGQSPSDAGTLGYLPLPPAGVRDRTPTEVLDAAAVWSNLELLGTSAGVCSRCSGAVDHAVTVCRDHDASEDVCERCGRRYAAVFEVACGSCHYATRGLAIVCLLATTELWAFLTDHGMNPLVPATRERVPDLLANYGEEVRSHDPLRVALTFAVDDDALTLTVDDAASVVEATRGRASDAG